MKYFRLFLY